MSCLPHADPSSCTRMHASAPPQALKIPKRHKEIDGLLHAVLAQLEKDKPRVGALDPETDRCAPGG